VFGLSGLRLRNQTSPVFASAARKVQMDGQPAPRAAVSFSETTGAAWCNRATMIPRTMPIAMWQGLSIGRLGWLPAVIAVGLVAAIVILTPTYHGV
jgi:hypothetical protein